MISHMCDTDNHGAWNFPEHVLSNASTLHSWRRVCEWANRCHWAFSYLSYSFSVQSCALLGVRLETDSEKESFTWYVKEKAIETFVKKDTMKCFRIWAGLPYMVSDSEYRTVKKDIFKYDCSWLISLAYTRKESDELCETFFYKKPLGDEAQTIAEEINSTVRAEMNKVMFPLVITIATVVGIAAIYIYKRRALEAAQRQAADAEIPLNFLRPQMRISFSDLGLGA